MDLSSYEPDDVNVVIITLDSCRFDTTEHAHIPFLNRIGQFRRAYTPGNYTVPAHTAFFAGHLPAAFPSEYPYYSEGIQQLWRIKTGRAESSNAWASLNGRNVMAGYEDLGFHTLGAGGVTQFNEGSQLREYFRNFLYWGPKLDEEPAASRNEDHFPLLHCQEIIDALKGHKKWLLFINCPETHFPYDTGDGISPTNLQMLRSIRPHFNLRESTALPESLCLSRLHALQVRALEIVDTRIQTLFSLLPQSRPILMVVCGDHGEMFGETFEGKPRFGHMLSSPEVLQVPLMISLLY